MTDVIPNAYAPQDYTLVASTWTKILEANKLRSSWKLYNQDASNPGRYIQPFKGSPLAPVLNGTANFVDVDALVPQLILTPKSSILARFNLDNVAFGTARTIFSVSEGAAANNFLDLQVDTTGQVNAIMRNSTAIQWTIIHATPLTADDIHTVELWHDGQRPYLKVDGRFNGVLVNVVDSKYWINDTSGFDSARIGALQISGAEAQFFEGQIDGLTVYSGISGNNKVPLADYNLGEGTGTSIGDSSGNGFTGTLTGTWDSLSVGNFLRQDSVEVSENGPMAKQSLWVFSANAITVNIQEFAL